MHQDGEPALYPGDGLPGGAADRDRVEDLMMVDTSKIGYHFPPSCILERLSSCEACPEHGDKMEKTLSLRRTNRCPMKLAA